MDFQLDFIGIGAPKAGTTQIADWLAEHPEICMAIPKEIHYFNAQSSYIHPQPNPNSQQPLSWYAKHFNHKKAGQKVGEFSTGYMYDTECASKVYMHNPNIKIVACLRHPAERAYSQYIMFRYYFKQENRDFDQLVQQQDEFIEKSKYFKQLNRYFQLFDKEQIHVVFLEDLKKQPEQTCRNLFKFLNVDESFVPPSLHGKANSSKSIKYKWVSKLMGGFSKTMVSLGLSGFVEWLKSTGFKKWVMSANSTPLDYPKMSNFARNYINEEIAQDITELEQLLNKDLSAWKQ